MCRKHILIIIGSYRFDVKQDGTLDNRKVFAFVSPGAPDGMSRFFPQMLCLVEDEILTSFFDEQASTATPRVTCTPDVVTASRCGIPLASSLARFILGRLRPISTLLGRAGWLFVPRQTFTMLPCLLRGILLRVRCKQ